PGAGRDNHYGFINYTSALAADRVYFNSDYHRQSFLQALPNFLKQFPDHTGLQMLPRLQERTQVLPLGLDLERLNAAQAVKSEGPPIILWNHRWEYDKGPQLFFQTLFELDQKGIDFRLVVLGPSFRRVPPIFKEARARLAHKLLHWGYAESEQEYARWLQQAHFLPVTSNQDFFGISVVEALYCGCYPLLPMRLAYPEHVPQALWGDYFYDSDLQFKQQLEALLAARPVPGIHAELTDFVKRYDWRRLAPLYDEQFNQLVYG
ncbi:MAG: DUF3524 domain-containing protein, partial [Phaeodactylibacter sp.]|nr:DUF3524 domain-containing protein [Phaeodactylibacter sp.]